MVLFSIVVWIRPTYESPTLVTLECRGINEGPHPIHTGGVEPALVGVDAEPMESIMAMIEESGDPLVSTQLLNEDLEFCLVVLPVDISRFVVDLSPVLETSHHRSPRGRDRRCVR